MTKQADVLSDPNYRPILDKGFLGLIDHMGSDAAVVQAARVSYGAGTKSVSEDRGLIRYLLRHQHSSPLEMNVMKFHIKCPIFVAIQAIRHRMGSFNFVSYRYSIIEDEYYYPDRKVIQPQSSDNKQGRSGELSEKDKDGVEWVMNAAYEHAQAAYQTLTGTEVENFYDLFSEPDPMFSDDYDGIARELARAVVPVGVYTEYYWKVDLHNLFHFLKLRCDPHAQYEIRAYADEIVELIKPLFPLCVEAWEDYSRQAKKISRMEVKLLKEFTRNKINPHTFLLDYSVHKESKTLKSFAEKYEMSVRELTEFVNEFLL